MDFIVSPGEFIAARMAADHHPAGAAMAADFHRGMASPMREFRGRRHVYDEALWAASRRTLT